MGDSYGDPQQNSRNFEGNRDDSRGNFRGGRGPGRREGGGFRIRLSDNEMRASRSLQEAFNLRSTVAVLGFAIRTLAQMLEEGKLDELVAQSRSQGNQLSGRREEGRQESRRNRYDAERENSNRGPKPNPFARPEKPKPSVTENKEQETDVQQKETTEEQTQNLEIENGTGSVDLEIKSDEQEQQESNQNSDAAEDEQSVNSKES